MVQLISEDYKRLFHWLVLVKGLWSALDLIHSVLQVYENSTAVMGRCSTLADTAERRATC